MRLAKRAGGKRARVALARTLTGRGLGRARVMACRRYRSTGANTPHRLPPPHPSDPILRRSPHRARREERDPAGHSLATLRNERSELVGHRRIREAPTATSVPSIPLSIPLLLAVPDPTMSCPQKPGAAQGHCCSRSSSYARKERATRRWPRSRHRPSSLTCCSGGRAGGPGDAADQEL
jgi:hypothetical protein